MFASAGDLVQYLSSAFGHVFCLLSREDFDDTQPAFVYVSDDMAWGRKNINDVNGDLFFAGEGDGDDDEAIGRDMALLAACNATIITRGMENTLNMHESMHIVPKAMFEEFKI